MADVGTTGRVCVQRPHRDDHAEPAGQAERGQRRDGARRSPRRCSGSTPTTMRASRSSAAVAARSPAARTCASGNCARARSSSAMAARRRRDASSHDLLLRAVNWKPVMAAVHGYVLGLALGLVLECDLIVAEAGTKFQVTETPRGLSGAKYWAMLNFRGGGAFATDVALTGRFFTAEEARAAACHRTRRTEGDLMDGGARAGRGGGEEPAARRALHRARAALVSRPVVARGAAAGEPGEAAPDRGLRRVRARLHREASGRPVQRTLNARSGPARWRASQRRRSAQPWRDDAAAYRLSRR